MIRLQDGARRADGKEGLVTRKLAVLDVLGLDVVGGAMAA